MTQLCHVTIKLNTSISLTENINDFYSKCSLSILINSEFHRFTASSPTSAAQMNLTGLRNNSLTNQDVPFDPCSDNRLRNSCMSLDEKTRTMSRSGSFRDGFEEGERVFRDFEGLHLLLFLVFSYFTPAAPTDFFFHVFGRTLVRITTASGRKPSIPPKIPSQLWWSFVFFH